MNFLFKTSDSRYIIHDSLQTKLYSYVRTWTTYKLSFSNIQLTMKPEVLTDMTHVVWQKNNMSEEPAASILTVKDPCVYTLTNIFSTSGQIFIKTWNKENVFRSHSFHLYTIQFPTNNNIWWLWTSTGPWKFVCL